MKANCPFFYVSVVLSSVVYLNAQNIERYSITNLSRHIKHNANVQPNKMQSLAWPDVSTNTTDFFFPNSKVFAKVDFTIALSNAVFVVGSTNALHCRLDNQSTNKIGYWTGTFACLTDRATNSYQLLPDLNPARAKSGIGFPSLVVGKAIEWDLPFVIDSNVPPGDYEFRASQGCVTSDAKYSWEIEASSLKIKVIK